MKTQSRARDDIFAALVACLVVAGSWTAELASAGSFFSPVLRDTFLAADQPGVNFGFADILVLGDDGDPSTRSVILLQFDLSSIPASAVVDSATLILTRSGGGGSANPDVNLLRQTSPWSEGSATWNSIDPIGSPVIGEATLTGSGPDRQIGNPTFRNLVQEWVSMPSSNYGFMISPVTVEGNFYEFSSLDSGPPPRLTVEFTVPAAPDLVVDMIGVSSPSVAQGATFQIDARVTNQGNTSSNESTLRYYLSTDPAITTADSQLGTDAIPALGIGQSSLQSEVVTAPGTPGSFWVGACVDQPELSEDESNNCSSGTELIVTDEPPAAVLTVTKAGNGFGQVTSAPPGIDCGSTCSAEFSDEAEITLTATPAPGSSFVGWSGDCSGSGSCVLTLSTSRSVVATFDADEVTRTLSVERTGAGSGQVTSSPAGINCGSTCTAQFSDGETVALSANPAPGSVFGGWTGACGGTAGCSVSMSQDRMVSAGFLPAVEASFSFSPNQPAVGNSVAFTDQSSGSPTSWEWSFGDGGTASSPNPTHTYNTAGTFPITLSVSNGVSVDSVSQSITVTPETLPLRARFNFQPTVASAGQTVTFDGRSSEGGPTSFEWSFGDGATARGQVVTHSFTAPGTYGVTLTVANGATTNITTRSLTVIEATGVTADFSFRPAGPVAGREVLFEDLSTGGVTSWQWSFGDGNTSTAQNPSHTYDSAGSYTVKLGAASESSKDETSRRVTVSSPFAGVELTATRYVVREGRGAASVAVRRGGISSETTSVVLDIIAGSAQRGTDFSAPEQVLIEWSAGDAATKDVTIDIIDDDVNEPTERLDLRLIDPKGVELGTITEGRIRILDDDIEIETDERLEAVGGEAPVTASSPAGRKALVWTEPDSDGRGVFAQILGLAGEPRTAPFRVADSSSGDQFAASVAWDADERLVISWLSDRAQPSPPARRGSLVWSGRRHQHPRTHFRSQWTPDLARAGSGGRRCDRAERSGRRRRQVRRDRVVLGGAGGTQSPGSRSRRQAQVQPADRQCAHRRRRPGGGGQVTSRRLPGRLGLRRRDRGHPCSPVRPERRAAHRSVLRDTQRSRT